MAVLVVALLFIFWLSVAISAFHNDEKDKNWYNFIKLIGGKINEEST